MKLSTTLNKKSDAVRGSVDAVSAARSFGSLSKDLHESLRAVIANMGKCPEWARAYVRGFQDCLTGSLYQTDLIHGGYIDGVFYSTHKKRADYYETLGIGAKVWNDTATDKGHYWQEYVTGNGVTIRGLKPFFISD